MKVLKASELRLHILRSTDRVQEGVGVPEWGGVMVYVRSLTAEERDRWETSLYYERGPDEGVNTANMRARLVAMCAVDVDGAQVFNAGDVEELGSRNAAAVDRLFELAKRLNRLDRRDLESLTKKSESGPTSASSADSPSPSEKA